VELWNTPGSRILDNDISDGRDGVFSVTSRDNLIRGNRFRALRYAVHFMYTNTSTVADNTSLGNDIGYAMMYSGHLTLAGNVSDGDRAHGLLFNYANDSRIEGNVVRGSEKCVFIYNANKNRFVGNWFEGLPDRRAFHRRLRAQCDHGQCLRRQPHAGDVCRHAHARLGRSRVRQLLERQSGLRSFRPRHRRCGVPAERCGGPSDLAGTGRETAAEQPGIAGAALGAGGLPGDPSRRRVG
jgi:parallel beta-helix repeat protein